WCADRGIYGNYGDQGGGAQDSPCCHDTFALSRSAVENPSEGTRSQFIQGQASELRRVALWNGAAVNRTEEEVKQALSGRGVVENPTHQSSLRRLRDKIL